MSDRDTTVSIQDRDLARKAVEQDLLGPDALFGPDEPAAPEGYVLIHCLGHGGGGEVYLARDTRLERPVAIKYLAEAGPADLERFRREARFTARLNNPSIVQVYELGEVAERPYIAMQYVDGGNLADAELDTFGVVRVVREVAAALKCAHAEGIVHRDIKPENILLDRQRRAYLTDFGIARNIYGGQGDTISQHGQIIGTPGLMPPEQARGEIQAVDARSDIYALGATLFVKLTGRYPFVATNLVDVLHAVIHEEPPLPRSINAAIPRRLEAIIVKCLQKAREARYQKIEEVIDDLDRFLAGARIGSESAAWFRRLAGNVPGAPPPPEPADDIQNDPYWTIGLEIVRELSAWDTDLYRVSGSLTRSFSRLDAVRGRLDDILTERPDTAWARFYRGVALFRRGLLHEALEEMERAIDRVKNLAGAYFELGRLYLALHLREQHVARKHLSHVGVKDGLSSTRHRLAQALVAFGEAQRLGGELPDWLDGCTAAVSLLQESDYPGCVEICDRILAEEPDVEGVWKLRGDALYLAGDDPFESYDRALAVRRTYFEALFAKAHAHLSRGQIDEARAALEQARRIHPQYADAAALLARTYLIETRQGVNGGTLDTGLRLAEEALAMQPDNYDAAVTLGELKIEKGQAGGGQEWLASAIETLRAALTLEGCPNRVNLLTAQARLECARRARSEGRDPRPELEAVLEFCQTQGAQVSDNRPWVAIRHEADRELSRLD